MAWTFYNSSGEALVQHAESEATQAEMEAETAVAKFVPPDLVKNSPGVAKAWLQFEQSSHTTPPVISYNVTSVADGGSAGNTDITWATDFSGVEYVICGITDSTRCINDVTRSGAAATVQVIRTTSGAGQDSDNVSIIVFGAQV
jgi:hypothetical protein